MIYVTGDTHGDAHKDAHGDRYRDKVDATHWPEGQGLGHNDLVVVCGDFGGVGTEERYLKKFSWWEGKPWTTLFVDGNHENYDVIDAMPSEERFGGRVGIDPKYPHVIHLLRGYVYELPVSPAKTVRAYAMGGASSPDRVWRTEGFDWWEREMPSDDEIVRGLSSLDAVGWSVDYVFTHELPDKLRPMAVDGTKFSSIASGNDPVTSHLQYVYETIDRDALRCWFAGHYHVDKFVDDDHKVRVLLDDIVPLEDTKLDG